MKQILATAALFLLSTSALFAQKGARFEFKDKNDTYDFGTIKEGEKVTHVFEFKNVGDQPLQILKAEATCGCTKPEFSPRPVMPGKTGTIKVTFDSAGKPGPAHKDITIQSNAVQDDKSKDRYVLTMKGQVQPKS
jgi:hypothetical protein